MSKTVKKVLGAAALIAGTILSFTGVGTVIGLGLRAVGAALLASAASKPKEPQTSQEFGREVQLSGDPLARRKIVYGEVWTAGTLRFRQATGTDNVDLYMVLVLAGHECNSVPEVQADLETLTLDGSGIVTSPAKWAGLIQVRYHLGSQSQTVDTTLDSLFTEWTTAHRLRGLCYAVVKVTYDQDNMTQPPAFRFKVRGRKVYDPRLDTTVGGSGAHRVNDETTWAWSENAVLCARDYLGGVMMNGKRIAGVGVAAGRFVWANVMAEANICDELVALAGSPSLGNEKRYTANGVIDPGQSHTDVLRHFEVAMAGDISYADGAWRFYAGAYRAPSLHLQPIHFVGPLRFKVWAGESSRYDTAQGAFAAQAEAGSVIDYAPVSLASAVSGSERFFSLDLQLVNDVTESAGVFDGGARAQRIAKLLLEREAAGKTVQCTTSLYGLRAVPGETIQVTHAAFGMSAQVMRVIDVQLRAQPDGDAIVPVVDLLLEAGPSSLYAWSAEETTIGASTALTQNVVPGPFDGADGSAGAPGANAHGLIINGGFETGTFAGWSATLAPGALHTIVSSGQRTGGYALRTDGNGSTGGQIYATDYYAISPGDIVKAALYAARDAADLPTQDVIAGIFFRTAAGAPNGFTAIGTADKDVAGYQLLLGEVTAPANSADFTLEFYWAGGTNDGAWIIDDALASIKGDAGAPGTDGTDGTDALGTLPASFAPGYVGGADDFIFTLNAVPPGTTDAGEIRVTGSIFDHPDGTPRALTDQDVGLETGFGESIAGRFYVMWTDTAPSTRFATLTFGGTTGPDLVPIVYEAGIGWRAIDNANTKETFTPLATDCIIAAVEAATTSSGLTAIAKLTGGIQGTIGPPGTPSYGSLNADPYFEHPDRHWFDNAAWTTYAADQPLFSFPLITDGPVGRRIFHYSGGAARPIFSEEIPIDPDKTYRIAIWAREVANNPNNYLACAFIDGSGANIVGGTSDATGWTSKGTYHYWDIVDAEFPTAWTYYDFWIGADDIADATIPSNAKAVRLAALLNWSNEASCELELAEYGIYPTIAGSDILAGAIDLATKVSGQLTTAFAAAGLINANVTINADGTLTGAGSGQASLTSLPGSIAAGQIAANAVTTAALNALAVTAAKVAAGAIETDKLAALSVTAAKIAAATITADKLSVASLSAITADLGTVTAGIIALASSGYIRAGQTAYDTGTGFFLGFDGATPKFSLGDSGGSKITWDGTTLSVVGKVQFSDVQTFTPTWTGFASGFEPTGDLSYIDLGTHVMLWNDTGTNLLGTSNAATMTVSNLPAAIQPGTSQGGTVLVYDNGSSSQLANWSVSGATLSFFRQRADQTFGYLGAAGFTASGQKGVQVGMLIFYPK